MAIKHYDVSDVKSGWDKVKELLIGKGYCKDSEITYENVSDSDSRSFTFTITKNGKKVFTAAPSSGSPTSNTILVVKSLDGSNLTDNSSTGYSWLKFSKITETTNGISLMFVGQGSSGYGYAVFITKSKNDKLAFATNYNPTTNYSASTSHASAIIWSEETDISNSSVTKLSDYALIKTKNYNVIAKNTILYPAPITNVDDYCPSLFISPSSQFPTVSGVLRINGTNYLASGQILLKD